MSDTAETGPHIQHDTHPSATDLRLQATVFAYHWGIGADPDPTSDLLPVSVAYRYAVEGL